MGQVYGTYKDNCTMQKIIDSMTFLNKVQAKFKKVKKFGRSDNRKSKTKKKQMEFTSSIATKLTTSSSTDKDKNPQKNKLLIKKSSRVSSSQTDKSLTDKSFLKNVKYLAELAVKIRDTVYKSSSCDDFFDFSYNHLSINCEICQNFSEISSLEVLQNLQRQIQNQKSENQNSTNLSHLKKFKPPNQPPFCKHHLQYTNASAMQPTDFRFIKQIGSGSFGEVYKVKKLTGSHTKGKIYAMKVLNKQRLKNKDRNRTILERHILTDLPHHSFVVNCHYAFQDKEDLYLILDYVPNGDLFALLSYEFSESQVRFVISQLVLALCHLHRNNIIYRDLKPENILLDEVGYIKLTDFGLSKQLAPGENISKSFCGTVEYMAPEVIRRSGHGTAADFWSVGVLIYEMLFGKLPFRSENGRDRKATMDLILHGKLKMPGNISKPTQNILKDCLKRRPEKRLGYGIDGETKLKNHIFFTEIDWNALYKKDMRSPIQNIIDASNKANQNKNSSKNNNNNDNKMNNNEKNRLNNQNKLGQNIEKKKDNGTLMEEPLSADCQKTFQTFNYVPDTPKELKEDGAFSIPVLIKKLSRTKISDKNGNENNSGNAKENSNEISNDKKDTGYGGSQDNEDAMTDVKQTVQPITSLVTNKITNNNNNNTNNHKVSDRSTSPDSGSFHENKIEQHIMYFDYKDSISIKLYEDMCHHPAFLPISVVDKFHAPNHNGTGSFKDSDMQLRVEFDESKDRFATKINLRERMCQTLSEMEAYSEKETHQLFKHLCLLVRYIHRKKYVIRNLSDATIGFNSIDSELKFIKLLDLTCILELAGYSINDQVRAEMIYENFISLYNILEKMLFKNYSKYNRKISSVTQRFRKFLQEVKEDGAVALNNPASSCLKMDTIIDKILEHYWMVYEDFPDEKGELVAQSSLYSSRETQKMREIVLPMPPTARLPARPPSNHLSTNQQPPLLAHLQSQSQSVHPKINSYEEPNVTVAPTQLPRAPLNIPNPFQHQQNNNNYEQADMTQNGNFSLGNINGSVLAKRRNLN